MKTAQDVLKEWKVRGYIPTGLSDEEEERYLSYIYQAKDAMLSYCNIPLAAEMPDGLFYPWVEISYSSSKGANLLQGSGAVKSVTEGDTTITFDVGAVQPGENTVFVDYSAILNRFRRMP